MIVAGLNGITCFIVSVFLHCSCIMIIPSSYKNINSWSTSGNSTACPETNDGTGTRTYGYQVISAGINEGVISYSDHYNMAMKSSIDDRTRHYRKQTTMNYEKEATCDTTRHAKNHSTEAPYCVPSSNIFLSVRSAGSALVR